MPWCDITRKDYIRKTNRYPSDLSEREWELIRLFLPPSKPQGRPRITNLRCVVNAILYIASSGCQWRMLPKDFPAYSTVQYYFYAWVRCGLWETINHLLV